MDDAQDKRPASFREVQVMCLYQIAQETGSEAMQSFLLAGHERATATFKDSELMKANEEISALKAELAQSKPGLKSVKEATDAADG